MAKKYEKYIIKKPKTVETLRYHKAKTGGYQIYLDQSILPESDMYVAIDYLKEIMHLERHTHDVSQIYIFLGAHAEIMLGDEKHDVTSSQDSPTVVFIPAGLEHSLKFTKRGLFIGLLRKAAYG